MSMGQAGQAVAPLLAAAPADDGAAAILEEAQSLGLGPPFYPGAALLTLLLIVVHFAAPRLRRAVGGRRRILESFGGGFAAAYVFLHLLPELDEGHELLGLMIFVIPLVGFVIHYLLRHRFAGVDEAAEASRVTGPFQVRLANLAVYNGLMIYATPGSVLESGWSVLPVSAALVLHTIATDIDFGEAFRRPFDSIGRYVLAGAVGVGYVAVVVFERTNEMIVDIATAFLAGGVLYNVFRDETPEAGKARVGWFLAGVALFSIFVALSRA